MKFENGDERNRVKQIKQFANDDEALRVLIELQRDSAQYLLTCANDDLNGTYGMNAKETRLTQFDYNGDHCDYNPAAALLLMKVTNALCNDMHMRESAIATIDSLFFEDNDDFALYFDVIDFGTSLQDYYKIEWED